MRNERQKRSHYAFLRTLFCGVGSTNGASRSASAAIDAIVSVDHELAVLFGNSGNGAFVSASAASDAFIRNLISHSMYLLFKFGT